MIKKVKNLKFKRILPYLLIIALILIDQIVKWWVLNHQLFVRFNEGFIFGWGKNWDLFFWISCIIIIVLFLATIKRPGLQVYNLVVILAAAVSNLIDRIFRGGVVDYWQINYFGVNIFFNLADVLLILGVAIYAWQVGKEADN